MEMDNCGDEECGGGRGEESGDGRHTTESCDEGGRYRVFYW